MGCQRNLPHGLITGEETEKRIKHKKR